MFLARYNIYKKTEQKTTDQTAIDISTALLSTPKYPTTTKLHVGREKHGPNHEERQVEAPPVEARPGRLDQEEDNHSPKEALHMCGLRTSSLDHRRHEHEDSHRHKQLLAFLSAPRPTGKEGDNDTGKLPSDTLKAGPKWKCFAYGKSLPPPPKPQDHLALPTHASAVKDLQTGFDERTSSIKPAKKSQILRGLRTAFV